uniref:Oxysterol-binding protein n=1 Tax=Phallusia mammillata TaxID=59560 RepID=A0A6F9DMD3_9ASCI|nr:oxysterol-binding protein-related protein 8 [Phallusia mammillata]
MDDTSTPIKSVPSDTNCTKQETPKIITTNTTDVAVSPGPSKLSKKASLRLQKQSYKMEKKKAENEFKMTANNPAVIILSDWLKVRSTLKNWSRVWCLLKPGLLFLYKNSKEKTWIGTVSLASVEIIERPSKKDGFCFKIYNTMDQCMWASKGPKGETSSVLTNSLPTSYLILRAQTESDGQCWMDALELSRKCSNLLKKSLDAKPGRPTSLAEELGRSSIDVLLPDVSNNDELATDIAELQEKLPLLNLSPIANELLSETQERCSSGEMSIDLKRISLTDTVESVEDSTESCYSEESSLIHAEEETEAKDYTQYVEEAAEDLSAVGDDCQTETLEGENKSLIWMLLKQVRPGMDLSKVVLPTFILEPRSFLEKFSDYYYHADLLSNAAVMENAYDRIKGITKWYLSGFYKKPKGLKKPYNPILGETFRCKWNHPSTNSSTFFLAEQVSHHPPVSAFVISNRKDGFVINGSILAKSKFYGNSVSAVLDGSCKLNLLKHGEEYRLTLPYAHCKGIIYGKMTMEFGGKVTIACEKTGYTTELEFKLKPLLGGGGKLNEITGRILVGQRVLATLSGCWDQTVHLTDLNKGTVSVFWSATDEVKKSRLQRFIVDKAKQGDFESEKLWQHVTKAINNQDQIAATEQKSILEVAQREGAKHRKDTGELWKTTYFDFDAECQSWVYKYMDTRPWDDLNDIIQYESNGVIGTKTRHRMSPSRNPAKQFALAKSKSSNSSNNGPLVDSMEKRYSSSRQKQEYNEFMISALQPIQDTQESIIRRLDHIQLQLTNQQRNQIDFPWFTTVVSCIICIFLFQLYSYFVYS